MAKRLSNKEFRLPEFAHYRRRMVQLRYKPEDMDAVLISCAGTDEFFCKARHMRVEDSYFTTDDIKLHRSQYRRVLLERIKDYIAQVEQDSANAQHADGEETHRQIGAQTAGAQDAEMEADIERDKVISELFARSKGREEGDNTQLEDYYQRSHSGTNRKPVELWEESVLLQMSDSDDLNRVLLKQDVERSVRKTGIEVTIASIKRIYWSPELMYYFRHRVRIAYNPEDLESVLVYCAATGKYICEAFDMHAGKPRYIAKDI